MDLFKIIELLKTFDYYVHSQTTGRPKEFAKKLRISESSFYHMLKEVKQMGGKVEYNYKLKSYCYKDGSRFYFGFQYYDQPEYGYNCLKDCNERIVDFNRIDPYPIEN